MLSYARLRAESQRNQYSDFLMPLLHAKDNQYLLTDDTIGYAWELVCYSNPTTESLEKVASLFKTNLPKGSIIQFFLYASPCIQDSLDEYKHRKSNPNSVIQSNVAKQVSYFNQANYGIEKLSDIPTRKFKLYLFIKSTQEIEPNTIRNIEEKLGIFHPQHISASELLSIFRQIFNNPYTTPNSTYDHNRPLFKQIIDTKSDVQVEKNHISFGKSHVAASLSPQSLPKKLDSKYLACLVGGTAGIDDNNNQLLTPFIYSLSVIVGKAKKSFGAKYTIMDKQRPSSRYSKVMRDAIGEYDFMQDKLGDGEPLLQAVPSIIIFAKDKTQLDKAIARATNIWESGKTNFKLIHETHLANIVFLSSLPFGLIDKGNNIKSIDRWFALTAQQAAYITPHFGDNIMHAHPSCLFHTRRGQLAHFDFWDERAINKNFIISAGSGAGKSFLLNYIIQSYLAENALVRLIDIGYSYKKQVSLFNGKYLDIKGDSVILNPFDFQGDDDEFVAHKATLLRIVMQMVYSSSNAVASELEWSLVKSAIEYTYILGNQEHGIDCIASLLSDIQENYANLNISPPQDRDKSYNDKVLEAAKLIAYNLSDFTSGGKYGSIFNGKSNIDIGQDPFVVIELENLKGNAELMGVMIMQLLSAITQNLYLSDKSIKKLFIFDEFASALASCSQKDMIAAVFEEGYRRARKYNGSCGVVLQGMQDLTKLGSLGDVLNDNATFKLLLAGNYDSALKTKFMEHLQSMSQVLKSVVNNKPHYSEFFLHTPFGNKVLRHSVDKFSYMVNNTEGDLTQEYYDLIDKGLTPLEAIEQQVSNH